MKNLNCKLFIPGFAATLFLILTAFAPPADDPLNKLLSALQQWVDTYPQEKVHLHMDKPYYSSGDTIWFKAYLTAGSRHKFSSLSGALYVDLINEKDSILKNLKLPVTNGMVMGDFALEDDLRQGNYRVRAYTQWMRNAGEAYYFDKTFTIGDPVSNNIMARAAYQYKTADNKPLLTATLTYAQDNGIPLTGKSVDYEIIIGKKTVWRSTGKTDAKGNIALKIPFDDSRSLSGAYIKTSLKNTGSQTVKRDFPIKAYLAQSDVQFFPEGGNLVAGLTSQVGFKAVGIDGLGVAVKGKITDENNKEVATLQVLHAGMGSFTLKPETGRTYTATVVFQDKTSKTIVLPKALMEGYVMNVSQNADTVLLRINSTSIMSSAVNVIVQTGGEVIMGRSVRLNNGALLLRLPKKSFPTGIAQFTLFNAANQPLAERIAFIHNNDYLQLNLKADKEVFNSKEPVALALQSLDSKREPTLGFFSVAVIDETKVPVKEDAENTIFSNLLLTADLKGYVERPNYYFSARSEEVDKALDNLMLTQGYRRFTWQGLTNLPKPAFQPEGLLNAISGTATTFGDKPVANAAIMLLSVKARIHKLTTTDADGRFKFDGILLTDSIKFAVQARSPKNSDNIKVVLDSVPKQQMTANINLADVNTDIAATIKAYLDNMRRQDSIFEKLNMLDKVHRLRQITINANKPKVQPYTTQGMIRIPDGYADQTYYMKEANCAMLTLCFAKALNGIVFKEYTVDMTTVNLYPHCYVDGYLTPMGIILDGRPLKFEEAASVLENGGIDPESVYKVDVIKNPAGPARVAGLSLMIFTKANYVRQKYNPSIANLTPKGFNKAREFYSPRYDLGENSQTLPDARSTIYWSPKISTGVDGQTTIKYFNADGPGTYRVVVEGMNAEGELGRQVLRYTVK